MIGGGILKWLGKKANSASVNMVAGRVLAKMKADGHKEFNTKIAAQLVKADFTARNVSWELNRGMVTDIICKIRSDFNG